MRSLSIPEHTKCAKPHFQRGNSVAADECPMQQGASGAVRPDQVPHPAACTAGRSIRRRLYLCQFLNAKRGPSVLLSSEDPFLQKIDETDENRVLSVFIEAKRQMSVIPETTPTLFPSAAGCPWQCGRGRWRTEFCMRMQAAETQGSPAGRTWGSTADRYGRYPPCP